MRTLTEDQAVDRLQEHIQAAVEQLVPRPGLEPELVGTMACDDPTDGGPLGRVFVEAHYRLLGVAPGDNAPIFARLHQHWTREGYVVLNDLRDRARAPQLKVRHPGDGFSVSLRQNLGDELRISGSSPCVWPAGDPRGTGEGHGDGDGHPSDNGTTG